MGLLYAALLACITTTCAWQAQMTVRNPENNPLLNDPNLGPLQSAWKYQVRALNQTDYKQENVIRAGLNGTPSDKPTPLGSNMYIEYGDYSCNTSSKPLSDMLKAAKDAVGGEAGSVEPVEGVNYLDFYVVHNQPLCNILRSPLLKGGCDFWLRKSELPEVLERAENTTRVEDRQTEENSKTATLNEDVEKEKTHKFEEALFRSLPTACRYAFISACGYPNDIMYDKSICEKTQTDKTSLSSES